MREDFVSTFGGQSDVSKLHTGLFHFIPFSIIPLCISFDPWTQVVFVFSMNVMIFTQCDGLHRIASWTVKCERKVIFHCLLTRSFVRGGFLKGIRTLHNSDAVVTQCKRESTVAAKACVMYQQSTGDAVSGRELDLREKKRTT